MTDTIPSIGRYALYKSGTDRLVDFLTDTATACRRSVTAKATKSGKVHSSDLVRYAEIISTWNPPPDIPAHILELTNDVIIGRTASSDFYTSRHTQPTAQEILDDEGHLHFIDVLHNVRQLLRTARMRMKATRREGSKEKELDASATPQEALVNLFELLKVEEPSASKASDTKRNIKTATAAPMPVLEVEEEEEKRFALTCFLLDLQEIRAFVFDIWTEYHRGETSLNVSIHVTETALGVIRRADAAFIQKFPDFAHYEAVLACLGYRVEMDEKADFAILVCNESGEALDPKTSAAVLLCPDAAATLQTLRHIWLVLAAAATRGATQPDGPGSKTTLRPSNVSGGHSFSRLMKRRSADLYDVVTRAPRANEPSEFKKVLDMLEATKAVRMSAVSDCQIYMHIHDILADHLDAGCIGLIDSIRKFEANANQLYKLMKTFRKGVAAAHPFLDRLRAWAAKSSKWFIMLKPSSSLDIWRSFPAITAFWINTRLVGLHMIGLEWAREGNVILSMGHLYNAARRLGLIPIVWEDMEWMLREHSSLMVDLDQKRNGSSFASQYCLATGMPLSMFANPLEQKRGTHRGKGAKDLFTGSQYLEIERAQAASDKALGIERAELEEVTLQKLTEKFEAAKRSGQQSKQLYHSPTYTGIQLLRTCKRSQKEDECRMNFDYLCFWLRCAELFENMADESHSWRPNIAAGTADELFIDTLLLDADSCERQRSAQDGEIGKAAAIMTEFIKEHGNHCTSKVAEASKGYDASNTHNLTGALQLNIAAMICATARHTTERGETCEDCTRRYVGHENPSNDREAAIFGPTSQKFEDYQTLMMEVMKEKLAGRLGLAAELPSGPKSAYAATIEDADDCDSDLDDQTH